MKITIEISDSVAQALSQHWTQQPIERVIAALAIMEATEYADLTADRASLAKAVEEAAQ